MRKVKTEDSVGLTIAHDLTRIIRGQTKGRQYKKGDIIMHDDIEMLKSMGKSHIFVLEEGDEKLIHENEAAQILADLSENRYMVRSEVKEGKLELIAEIDGFFRVDSKRLFEVNMVGGLMIATIPGNRQVKKGDKLAGMRVIPLLVEPELMDEAKKAAGNAPILELLPFRELRVGLVITGDEVYYGRVKESFTELIGEKLAPYKIEIVHHQICPDDLDSITSAIQKAGEKNADLIICTGGMSVDPDDRTPDAIRESGAEVVTYGAPVLPGAMFMMGYYQDGTAVVGIPAGAIFMPVTIFDLVLPYILAGVELTREDIAAMGNGGLCMNCEDCRFPNCGWGLAAR